MRGAEDNLRVRAFLSGNVSFSHYALPSNVPYRFNYSNLRHQAAIGFLMRSKRLLPPVGVRRCRRRRSLRGMTSSSPASSSAAFALAGSKHRSALHCALLSPRRWGFSPATEGATGRAERTAKEKRAKGGFLRSGTSNVTCFLPDEPPLAQK